MAHMDTAFYLRSRRHADRQRLPARAGMAGGTRCRTDRAFRLAHPSQDRHERRIVRQPAAPRDPARHQRRNMLERLRNAHAAAYRVSRSGPALPGARELLAAPHRRRQIPWAIATSGRMETARPNLERLASTSPACRSSRATRSITPSLIPTSSSPPPSGLPSPIETSIVVGDSIWDMLAAPRARALGVGLLCGGYGEDELQRAGAFRVYEDPAYLLAHLDEVGGRR